MYTNVDILSEKVNQHFRHPIPSVLYERGILTVGQMVQLTDNELVNIRNFGRKSLFKVWEFRNLVSRANNLLALNYASSL